MTPSAAGSAALLAAVVSLAVAPGPVTARLRVRAVHGPAARQERREHRGRRQSTRSPRTMSALIGAGVALSAAALGGDWVAGVLGMALGVGIVLLGPRWAARRARPRPDPLTEAGAWDQLAACLRAGLSLDRAARAVTPVLPSAAGRALTRVADLVALGADPAAAWAPALDEPATARLARAARRSARSGSAVADVAETVAADVRAEAADAVATRAERAGVLVTGPLGLCFLPAFLALGIVPVVVGLAGPLLEQR